MTMRALFLTADFGGNLPPTRALAAELVRRGVEVEVAGFRAPDGALAVPFAPASDVGPEAGLGALRRLQAMRALTRSRKGSDAAAALIRERRPDVVVLDALTSAPIRGALATGAPTAVLFHTFGTYWVDGFTRGMSAVLFGSGHGRATSLWGAATARILLTDRDLDPGRDDPRLAGFDWTGTTEIGAEPAPRSPGARPRVLVTLSTTAWPGMRPVYQRIIDALAGGPFDVVVTTGGVDLGGALRGAPNVELLGWAPHDELLPGIDLVVGHGGHSTTMKVLAHGIPLLVLPINPTADQELIGATLQEAGIGRLLPKSANPAAIRGAIDAILGDGTTDRAAAAGRRLRAQTPGAAVAADRIVEAAKGTTQ